MQKSSETNLLMDLVIPENYSRWGWYCAAGSPRHSSAAGPPPPSEGPTTSNLGSFPKTIGRQVAAIANLLWVSISRMVLHGANPGVSKPMKQAMKYGWFCWVLINTSRILFVICFLMTKKSRCFTFSRFFWTFGSIFSPFGRMLLVLQHLCILVAGT